MDNLKPSSEVVRSTSSESGMSDYEDDLFTFEVDDDDDYYDDDDDDDDDSEYICDVPFISSGDEKEVFMNPHLYRDVENLISIYGEQSLKYRLFESIDEIDIELQIPIGFLDDVRAEAWELIKTKPLVVRIEFSLSTYLTSSYPPTVEVFQETKKESFRFGKQMRKILENFLLAEWHHLHKDYLACIEAEEKMKNERTVPADTHLDLGSTDGFSETDKDEAVARLVSLGFEPDLARNALLITRGDIEEATILILDSPHECIVENIISNVPVRSISQTNGERNVYQLDGSDKFDDQPQRASEEREAKDNKRIKTGIKKQLSRPAILNKFKRMLPAFTCTTSLMPRRTSALDSQHLNLMPLLTLNGTNAKNVPSISDGFLVQIFRYVRQRIPSMNEYCVICDEQHVFQNGTMLKPAVCNRELCVFSFKTLGVMADVAEDIAGTTS